MRWDRNHPYFWRTTLREYLPWFLIDWGFAGKGVDCKQVGAKHHWYSQDDRQSACYYCRVVREGQLWRKDQHSPDAG
jgi:hypothetical protein